MNLEIAPVAVGLAVPAWPQWRIIGAGQSQAV